MALQQSMLSTPLSGQIDRRYVIIVPSFESPRSVIDNQIPNRPSHDKLIVAKPVAVEPVFSNSILIPSRPVQKTTTWPSVL
jgi:hypothetical protein